MGKREKERLHRILTSHLDTIHETFQALDQALPSSLEKVKWEEVVKMGDQVSKQATIVGMLWTGEAPKAKGIEENMAAYFNTLQGLILLSHGSTVGGGPTLCSSIHTSMKQVLDCSFKLMMEIVSSYGSCDKDIKLTLPQLVGAVWEACSALKKTPTTNVTAIGRAMTKVAVSVKDVLREMKELKPASSCAIDEGSDVTSLEAETEPCEDNNSSDGDLGNDLTPEEMKVAQAAIGVVSEVVVFMKELIRNITSLIKQEKPNENGEFVDALEKLLKLCQGIGEQIDELGACLYPPQEVPAMEASLEKISSSIGEVQVTLERFESSSEPFIRACESLKSSLKQMQRELDCITTTDFQTKMQKNLCQRLDGIGFGRGSSSAICF